LNTSFNLTEELGVHIGFDPVDPFANSTINFIDSLEEHQLGISHLAHQVCQQSVVQFLIPRTERLEFLPQFNNC